MSTRLTTGLLSCLMTSLLVGCASSPESLIRGQSPSAYPMPAGVNTGHRFGPGSPGVPFPYNTVLGRTIQGAVRSQADAYYGRFGSHASGAGGYAAAGFPVSTHGSAASWGGGHYHSVGSHNADCENGYCEDPHGHHGHCWNGNGFWFGHDCRRGHGYCHHCDGQGCPHCKGTGYGNGYGNGGQWAPTHLYHHMYKIPQGMVYPQNPTPGAITVYPYYTHKGPDDFFHPPLKN